MRSRRTSARERPLGSRHSKRHSSLREGHSDDALSATAPRDVVELPKPDDDEPKPIGSHTECASFGRVRILTGNS